jgi:hypothetical protein
MFEKPCAAYLPWWLAERANEMLSPLVERVVA